jgi:hypothetical protein
MGEFAKRKIQTIIDHLNQAKPLLSEHRQLISMIGEPILRHKLEAMWKKQYSEDEEISVLENRLRELYANKEKNQS